MNDLPPEPLIRKVETLTHRDTIQSGRFRPIDISEDRCIN